MAVSRDAVSKVVVEFLSATLDRPSTELRDDFELRAAFSIDEDVLFVAIWELIERLDISSKLRGRAALNLMERVEHLCSTSPLMVRDVVDFIASELEPQSTVPPLSPSLGKKPAPKLRPSRPTKPPAAAPEPYDGDDDFAGEIASMDDGGFAGRQIQVQRQQPQLEGGTYAPASPSTVSGLLTPR